MRLAKQDARICLAVDLCGKQVGALRCLSKVAPFTGAGASRKPAGDVTLRRSIGLVSHFGLGLGKARVSDWASALPWGRDESELLTELQAGSETAFDWLVTHYHAPVYNLILGMLGDASDAADGTQEVFLKAFRGIRGFRHGSSLKTWLYRIAIREALNHKRWFKRHLQKTVSIDAELEEGREHLEIEDLCATPFEQLAARETQVVVQRALLSVPHVFRVAVILRDLEGFSYEEVAEILECSIGTVKSRILRGRRALKEILEPLLSEPESHPGTEHGTTHSVPAKSHVAKKARHSPFKDAYAAAWPVASVAPANGMSLANNPPGEVTDEL